MADTPTAIEQSSTPRKKWPWLTVSLAIVLVVALGIIFGSRGGGGDTAAAGGDGTPVSGGTLQFALLDYQRSPDPQWGTNYAESIIGNNITDKLTWQDPNTGEITPWLAQSWEYNKDLTEFTFHLRHDVTFSDGTPFNAAAVKANFDQYVRGDEKLGITGTGAVLLHGYVDTRTPDEYTAVVVFKQPNASFLQASSFTANAQPGFLSLSTLTKSADERANPKNVIGTGPFVYESWQEQVKTVLVKRKDYNWSPPALHHQGPAYLDKIVFNTIPEASVRTGSLRSGTIDATLDVGTTDEEPLRAAGFSIISRQVSGTAIRWDLNTSLAPTNDLAVRKAIQRGWNRDAIAKTVLTKSYTVANSVLASSVPGFADYSGTTLKYDPDGAKKLLDDAGWVPGPDGIRVKDGKRLTIKVLGINNLVANKPAYESIQQDLKQIGIDVQLTVLPLADYAAEQTKAKTKYNAKAANRSRNDPGVLRLAFGPDFDNGVYLSKDFPGYDEIVSTLDKLDTTLDPAKRKEYAKAAQDLIVDKYALTNPVYNPSQVIAHAPYVHGIVFDAQSRNHFVDTWKSK
ncbi:ABC transporter substrate-binding protein [Kribbella sp. NPDC055071]